MKIADQVKEAMANVEPAWANASADLIQAILERAMQMTGPELSHFVSEAPTMRKYAENPFGIKEFESTRAIVAAML